jgi:hypothetical protein
LEFDRTSSTDHTVPVKITRTESRPGETRNGSQRVFLESKTAKHTIDGYVSAKIFPLVWRGATMAHPCADPSRQIARNGYFTVLYSVHEKRMLKF